MSIASNIAELKSLLPVETTLVAVSKTKTVELIMEAYNAGHRDFGENRIQELVEKQRQLPEDIRWHAIGHLQTNKVKMIAPFVHLIHAVDSEKLLREINKRAEENERIIDVLLQVYIATESSKFGLDKDELFQILRSGIFDELKSVRVRGLMGMATYTDNDAQVSSEFAFLKACFDEAKILLEDQFNILSMGMSGDYQVALENGSNMVRIGNSIFGARV